jgi:lipopolysaccharide biosynthesis regulator YciM
MESTATPVFTILMLALLLISWLLGYVARGRRRLQRRSPPDQDYFIGLNYLLNDEPDDAIDVFIGALEISAQTYDTHLALGKLLRRRGKVDRSIAHYQTLLGSRSFSARQLAGIRIQLLRSFIAAGLLDRAEQLLLELRQSASSLREEALRLAIMLYQTEKEWRPALDAAGELLQLVPAQHRHDLLMQMTHFHCELAELSLQEAPGLAEAELRQALVLFKGNIRVYLLLARLQMAAGLPREALWMLYKAVQVEPQLFAELLPDLRDAVRQSGMDSEQWLPPELEHELSGDSAWLVEKASRINSSDGAVAAIGFLLGELRTAPSLPLLKLTLQLAARDRVLQDDTLDAGAGILALHLQGLPRYRCENCGFELKQLYWACPGCSCWGMVKPINTMIAAAPWSASSRNT